MTQGSTATLHVVHRSSRGLRLPISGRPATTIDNAGAPAEGGVDAITRGEKRAFQSLVIALSSAERSG